MATSTSLHLPPAIPALPQRLERWRKHIVDTPEILYLANAATGDKVEWVRNGRSHRLRLKNDNTEDAMLTYVGVIDSNDFYGHADAGYRGPTNMIKGFYAAKQTMAFTSSSDAPFAVDHLPSITALQAILNNTVTPGFTEKGGMMMTEDRFKLHNVLFEASSLITSIKFNN